LDFLLSVRWHRILTSYVALPDPKNIVIGVENSLMSCFRAEILYYIGFCMAAILEVQDDRLNVVDGVVPTKNANLWYRATCGKKCGAFVQHANIHLKYVVKVTTMIGLPYAEQSYMICLP